VRAMQAGFAQTDRDKYNKAMRFGSWGVSLIAEETTRISQLSNTSSYVGIMADAMCAKIPR
jgi:hypothetical protein